MTFTTQQWYSICGLSSDVPPSAIEHHTLTPGQSVDLPVVFVGHDCTEAFVFSCQSLGQAVDCRDRLHVTIGE